ncbi:hypothetical protein AAE478_003794 [Parahypoxylon ruwenzoriense]
MVSLQTYQIIHNWIGRLLEHETAKPGTSSLTDAQRKLLEKLELTLPLPMAPPPDPDIGDTNWVGMLHENRAAQLRIPSGYCGMNFLETPAPSVRGVLRWYCHVRIDEHPEPFPGPAGGLFPDGTQPSFSRKKEAKQFAAKCAIEWLKAQKYIPQVNVNFLPAQQRQITPPPSGITANKTAPSPPSSLSPPSPKRVKTSAPKKDATAQATQVAPGPIPKSPFDSDEVSAVHELTQLCNRYKFAVPQYRITESTRVNGFYDGSPDLGILAPLLPPGVGRVEGVISKKVAREKIAQELLVPLRNLAAQRDEENRRFLESPPSEVEINPKH